MAIAVLPILAQPLQVERQDLRGEILALDPRQDQEAHVIRDQMQAAPFQRFVPANPGFAMATLESSRRPGQQGKPVRADRGHVADGFSDRVLKAQVVVLGHYLVPLAPFLELDRADDDVVEGEVRGEVPGPPIAPGRRRRETPRQTVRGRERNLPLAVQAQEQLPTGAMVPGAIRPAPIPFPAQQQGQLDAARLGMPQDQCADELDIIRGHRPTAALQKVRGRRGRARADSWRRA